MQLFAFQGFRYTADVGDAGELAAPPFDQIDDEARDRFHAKSPYHFAHLTRPGGDGDSRRRAREIHQKWLDVGAIEREREPALYPYLVELAGGERRLGLCGMIGLGPSAEGDLRPHEETVEKPLADRLALLEATRIDLEPVMLIADDAGALERMLATDVSGQPLVSYFDSATGDRHHLYRLSGRSRIQAYQQALASSQAVIADGHHRTKVAQMFAATSEAPEGTAACAKLAVLTSVASRALRIDPIHRGVLVPLERSPMETLALERRVLQEMDGAGLAAAVAATTQPAVIAWFQGTRPELWQLDADRLPPGTPGGQARLAVVLLHHQLLLAGGLPLASAKDGSIAYRSDPEALARMLESNQAVAGFWLPPMDPQAFATATEDGDVLPPKSTRFLPKLASGLVWCGHDAALL